MERIGQTEVNGLIRVRGQRYANEQSVTRMAECAVNRIRIIILLLGKSKSGLIFPDNLELWLKSRQDPFRIIGFSQSRFDLPRCCCGPIRPNGSFAANDLRINWRGASFDGFYFQPKIVLDVLAGAAGELGCRENYRHREEEISAIQSLHDLFRPKRRKLRAVNIVVAANASKVIVVRPV